MAHQPRKPMTAEEQAAHRRKFTVGVMDDEEEVHDLAEVSTGQLFNELLSRFAFESNGVDPRSLSLIELKNAIAGAEWPLKREPLKTILDIAEGSQTANSLPHIAKIAREALS